MDIKIKFQILIKKRNSRNKNSFESNFFEKENMNFDCYFNLKNLF